MSQQVSVDFRPKDSVEITLPQESASATLLVEQARALVQIEEGRFAAAQTKTTTLLAVVGVVASIGGGLVVGLNGREYTALVFILMALSGFIATGALLWSGAIALGALKKTPEPAPKSEKLTKVISNGFAPLLDQESEQAALVLLPIIAKQHGRVHKASEEVHEGFKQASRVLSIAVISGLFMALLVVLGATGKPQEVRLVKNPKDQSSAFARATIEKQ